MAEMKPAAVESRFGKHAPLETDSPQAGSDLGLLYQTSRIRPVVILDWTNPIPLGVRSEGRLVNKKARAQARAFLCRDPAIEA